MYASRKPMYEALEHHLDSKLLVYITGDRQGFETQINSDVVDIFIGHLDKIGPVEKISLYLYTRGGNTAAAWNIINLIRQYCECLQVVIPHKAHSAGTLISLGANSIMMTKQATLGPIDPSLNTPLNPAIPGAPLGNTYFVSVEAVKGYIEFAKEELGITGDRTLGDIMLKLSEYVHPLVLGQVYRSRVQIKMLAEKLLTNQLKDKGKIEKIISFLCSDSGSHDYTINRREARDNLDLKVETPSSDVYAVIKQIYDSISDELGFGLSFDFASIAKTDAGEYCVRRALLESPTGGSSCYLVHGIASVIDVSPEQGMLPQQLLQNEIIFEGWEHE